MKRSINSTGRQRITHGMVSFAITRTPGGDPIEFSANLDALAGMDLPLRARVSVEPYSGQSSMRFDFGTIGAIVAPVDTKLDEIDRGGEIIFRVKVIDEASGKLGKLLASGDRIPASATGDESDGRLPLLPVKPEALGERIWDISTAHGSRPHLLINSRIPGLAARIQTDPLLRGAILIEAFRKVLVVMLDQETGDEASWFANWKTYLADMLGVPFPDEDDDDENDNRHETFMNDALNAFADKFQFASLAVPTKAEDAFHE